MAESLKDLAMKLQQRKASQNIPQPNFQKTKEDDDEDTLQDEGEEEVEEKRQIEKSRPREMSVEERVAMEIEMLQNDGRFRVELLHQLSEVNKALNIIAEALVLNK